MRLSRCVLVLCLSYAVPGMAAQQRTNPDAAILQDFQARVKKYVDLHKHVEKQSPPLKETKDPAKIKISQDVMAAKLREARRDARQGDIFTPEIAKAFRRLMYPEVKGPEASQTKGAIKDDAPLPGSVSFKVNAKYPEGEPLPTVPPNVLSALPKLPEDLEYRIVGHTLILRDVDANLIVDFIPNAIR